MFLQNGWNIYLRISFLDKYEKQYLDIQGESFYSINPNCF